MPPSTQQRAATAVPAAAPLTTPIAASVTGLDAATAARRLVLDGGNELPVAKRRSLFRILLEVLRQPMFALLIGGGVVYLLLGDLTEALLLIAFASLSVVITIVQESRSEKVLAALRSLASPRARVLRDGRVQMIAGREVVCGDRLVVAEGDRIAADARLVEASELLLDESLLTGESLAVRKRAAEPAAVTPLPAQAGGEDQPWLYAGTLVVRGSGQALVSATGVRSEIGKIGHALAGIDSEQPQLQKQLRWLVRDFAITGAVIGSLTVLLLGLLRGSWLQALLSGIALGMSLLPEEFPLVLAVFMAMGAWRISQARVLTRRASAIETLGATTVLCTDKTGTLTENRMRVAALQAGAQRWTPADPGAPDAAITALLETALAATARTPTDPMDLALQALATRQMPERVAALATRPLLRAYGLQPDLFAVTQVLAGADGGTAQAFAKGAHEAIAELCGLDAAALAAVRTQADAVATQGMRVLAVATATLDAAQCAALPATPRGFAFGYCGLVGFADPLRATVPAAVAQCRSAGVRVVMITGDYPLTAAAIAREAGIEAAAVLSGDAIEALDDAQLARQVKAVSIYARIRPNQKLRIVNSLKAAGEVVAMTGDGVNDAPAIKAAHIGIAMGLRGTEVAREAAAIVLLDDDFGAIVKTIRLGRRIYDNLRKAIEYIIAVHVPIAGLALLPLLLGLPLILTPIHIAFLEMIIDPACSIVFEAETEEDDVMQRPPRDPKAPLLLRRRMLWALLQGLLVLGLLSGLLVFSAAHGLAEADLRVLMFLSLVLSIMALTLVNRSFSSSLLAAFKRPNRSLWILLGGVSGLLAVTVAWPPAQHLFRFGALSWIDVGGSLAVGGVSVLLLEALKARWFRAAPVAMPASNVRQ